MIGWIVLRRAYKSTAVHPGSLGGSRRLLRPRRCLQFPKRFGHHCRNERVPSPAKRHEPILIFGAGSLASLHHQQRKEVVQCLTPSAVTSLRPPAKPKGFGQGGLSAWFSENREGRGASCSAPFSCRPRSTFQALSALLPLNCRPYRRRVAALGARRQAPGSNTRPRVLRSC